MSAAPEWRHREQLIAMADAAERCGIERGLGGFVAHYVAGYLIEPHRSPEIVARIALTDLAEANGLRINVRKVAHAIAKAWREHEHTE